MLGIRTRADIKAGGGGENKINHLPYVHTYI